MDSTVISAAIAFLGVTLSITFSFFINRTILKSEIKKIEAGIEQTYASKLVEKRLEFYPPVYELLSDMGKKIRKVLMKLPNENIDLRELMEFHVAYDKLNSKYSLIFSSVSNSNSSGLRRFLLETIGDNLKLGSDSILPDETLGELRKYLAKLEVSLKYDVGVYIVEFQDAKKELAIDNYDDVLHRREEKRAALKSKFKL